MGPALRIGQDRLAKEGGQAELGLLANWLAEGTMPVQSGMRPTISSPSHRLNTRDRRPCLEWLDDGIECNFSHNTAAFRPGIKRLCWRCPTHQSHCGLPISESALHQSVTLYGR